MTPDSGLSVLSIWSKGIKEKKQEEEGGLLKKYTERERERGVRVGESREWKGAYPLAAEAAAG